MFTLLPILGIKPPLTVLCRLYLLSPLMVNYLLSPPRLCGKHLETLDSNGRFVNWRCSRLDGRRLLSARTQPLRGGHFNLTAVVASTLTGGAASQRLEHVTPADGNIGCGRGGFGTVT